MKKKTLLTFMLSAGWALWPEAQAQVFVAAHNPAMVNHASQTKQVSLKTALSEIEAKYKVSIAYQTKAVANRETVLPDQDFATVEEALQVTLKNHDLQFKKVKDRAYIVMPIPNSKGKPTPQSQSGSAESSQALPPVEPMNANEIAVANPVAVQAPDVTITGKVTGPNGDGLPGVTVLLKGTTVGATTGPDGAYSLRAPEATGTLVFSFIGFVTKEVAINGRTSVNVALQEDAKALNEVVVVGYGTQIAKDVTGSITSIKAADIKNMAVASPDALLQGKAAGVQVVQNAGTPGADVFVRVRGTASLRADSRPLFVIDGVPMTNSGGGGFESAGQRTSTLADINPQDIESMEVLKDGAATAIYGSRGSNGVILITTKKGKSGAPRINFDAYTGVQSVWRKFDLLSGDEMNEVIREGIANRNRISPANAQINATRNPELYQFLALSGNNTDWQNEIFQTAPISNYNVSLSGGEGKIRTFASLGVFNQEGTIIGQEFNRYNGRINLDYDATEKLKFGTNITYSYTFNKRVPSDFSGVSVLATALLRTPNLAVRDDAGEYTLDPLRNNGIENPVRLANTIILENRQKRLIGNLYAEYAFIPGLSLRTVFGIDNLDQQNNRFEPSFILRRQGNNEAQAQFSDNYTWVNDNTLNFIKQFGKHRITSLAGIGFQQNRYRDITAGGNTTASDLITNASVSQPFNPGNSISEWRLLSFFGRVNYSLMDRYILEASFRRDGSSRFGQNKKFGTFPAISAAWRVIEENFMDNIGFVSDLKLRAAYGVTGNQDGVDNFAARATYGGGRNYNGQPGISQGSIPNYDLGWESTKTTNAGVDVSFINNRINISADAYIKKTTDLLFQQDLPWTSGYWNIPLANIGAMENRGLEFMLSTVNINSAFKWTTDFNIAFNRNKITSLPNDAFFTFTMPGAYSIEGPYSRYVVGQPVGSFYGYQFQGVYSREEDIPAYLKTGNPLTHVYAGYPIILDANDDKSLNREDHVFIGNALPKHTGGITNTLSYKGLELNVFFAWSYGNKVNNLTRAVLESMNEEFNQNATVRDRWKKPGDITNVPAPMYGNSSVRDGFSFTDASSRFIEDGSFLRMRNATLAYNIPSALLSRVKMNSARVYVTGQNLLTITNYTGLDPENQNTGGNLTPTLGVDYLTQPLPRIVMLGINIGI